LANDSRAAGFLQGWRGRYARRFRLQNMPLPLAFQSLKATILSTMILRR
jgi:hypothetical protein